MMLHKGEDRVEHNRVLAERRLYEEGIIILVLQLQQVFHLRNEFHLSSPRVQRSLWIKCDYLCRKFIVVSGTGRQVAGGVVLPGIISCSLDSRVTSHDTKYSGCFMEYSRNRFLASLLCRLTRSTFSTCSGIHKTLWLVSNGWIWINRYEVLSSWCCHKF